MDANYSGAICLSQDSPTVYLKNNLIQGTTKCYNIAGYSNYVHSNNLSSDNASPDAVFQSKTVSFANASGADYHLSGADTVTRDTGTDLSSDAYLPFSNDIDGNSRPFGGAWDIGADEFTDFTAPAAIADLRVTTCTVLGEIDLAWTAPGNDGTVGTISNGKFRIQYSTITETQWGYQNAQVVISTTCSPLTGQFYSITGLTIETTYFLRIWTGDDSGNYSDLSNGATAWVDIEGSRQTMMALRPEIGPDPTFRLNEVYSYPNPAKNGYKPTIHIACGIADSVELKLFNIAGELVHSTEMNNLIIKNNEYAYEYRWDISNVASGVYVYYINAQHQGDKPIKILKKLAVIK